MKGHWPCLLETLLQLGIPLESFFVVLSELGQSFLLIGGVSFHQVHPFQDELPLGGPQRALQQLEAGNLQVLLQHRQDWLKVDTHLVRELLEGDHLALCLAVTASGCGLGIALAAEDVPTTADHKGFNLCLQTLIAKRFEVHFSE